jgi:hypothetical protein
MTLIDFYSETNSNATGPLDITGAALGQTFTGKGYILSLAKAFISKHNSPTGNVYIKIYSHTGTWGSSGVPDTLLATSDPVDAAGLSGSLALTDFTFSGANKIVLENGVHYAFSVTHDGNSTDSVYVGFDNSSPTHPGNKFYLYNGWHAQSTMDLIFYVYGTLTYSQEILSTHNAGYKWPGPYEYWYSDDNEVGNIIISGTKYSLDNFFRFPNVTIPAGSTIVSAKISLMTWNGGVHSMYLKIYGIAEDDTEIFPANGSSPDPTVRSLTSAYGTWVFERGMSDDSYYDSGDLATVVQEIVDRGGWQSGNAMGFKYEDNGMDDNTEQYFYNWDRWHATYASGKYPVLTIEYAPPPNLLTKDLKYAITRPVAITKSLKYEIDYISPTNKTFYGVKVAKDNINVLHTNDPRHLKFSSEFNTLKYYWDGTAQVHVQNPPKDEYTVTGYVEHNLGYFPMAMVYARDGIGANFVPLGFQQEGSGAGHSIYYYVTTTRLYFVVEGWSLAGDDDFIVDFYFKIFKNNLNL